MDILEKEKFIFGGIFFIANRLQIIGDKYLGKDNMTMKQWFLTIIISQFKDKPPTLSEVAELMGSSRQNIKQLAIKLEKSGFVAIERDKQDARALRLKLTDRSREFWDKRQDTDESFVRNIFTEFDELEIDTMFNGMNKLFGKIEKMENEKI